MSSNGEPKEQKGKSQYFTNLEEHESLYLETRESGQVGIKYYQYKKVVNPMTFAASIELIEKELNKKGYYIEGRSNKSDKPTIQGEVKESAKGDSQITADGNDIDSVVTKYIEKRRQLNSEAKKIQAELAEG